MGGRGSIMTHSGHACPPSGICGSDGRGIRRVPNPLQAACGVPWTEPLRIEPIWRGPSTEWLPNHAQQRQISGASAAFGHQDERRLPRRIEAARRPDRGTARKSAARKPARSPVNPIHTRDPSAVVGRSTTPHPAIMRVLIQAYPYLCGTQPHPRGHYHGRGRTEWNRPHSHVVAPMSRA